MAARRLFVVSAIYVLGYASWASAQVPTVSPFAPKTAAPASATAPASNNGWRPADADTSATRATPSSSTTDPSTKAVSSAPRQPIAKVTNGSGALPNDKGQVWREYDITPYTARMTSNPKPEQAIVDWILRETSYEAWHSDPVCLLSADKKSLRCYHTPEMQATVAEIVDRFVNPDAEQNAFGLRIVTVGSPNWRSKVIRTLHPVATQTQGVQAWLLTKEDAAMLFGELRKRSDVREHTSPNLMVFNGQTLTVSTVRPRNYIRNLALRPDAWPAFEPETAQFQEGFTLEMSPLISIDSRTCDAIVKCNIDQVERMLPVSYDVPTAAAPRQRTQVEVPQTTGFHMLERFRWPADQVMLISFGVVATPIPGDSGGQWLMPTSGPGRADLLLLLDNKGKQAKPNPNVATAPAGAPGAPAYQPAR